MSEAEKSMQPKPWWNERTMWLVVGGPLTVVVAGFVTLFIALRYPDPVLDTTSQAGTAEKAGPVSMQPAVKARNHAATGGQ